MGLPLDPRLVGWRGPVQTVGSCKRNTGSHQTHWRREQDSNPCSPPRSKTERCQCYIAEGCHGRGAPHRQFGGDSFNSDISQVTFRRSAAAPLEALEYAVREPSGFVDEAERYIPLDLALAPDEGRGVPVVGFGEVADCLDQLRDAGKAGSGQGLSAEPLRRMGHLSSPGSGGSPKMASLQGGPRVRIRLPPAESRVRTRLCASRSCARRGTRFGKLTRGSSSIHLT
jgi:hypothetical protein